MSNIIQFLKEHYPIIFGTILIYQIILTIFFFSTANLVLLATIIVIVAGSVVFANYKDSIIDFFKRK